MTNREYTGKVMAKAFPDEIEVPLDTPFVNDAGVIQNLVLAPFSSAVVIASTPGAVRSNHYHKTDWHYMYVLDGELWYYWRPALSKERAQSRLLRSGTLMFTPPMTEHAVYFPTPTRILVLARNIRDHASHEADLVRVKLIEVVNGSVRLCD